MLPQDQGGVVDSSLKVYRTLNVCVVDASIIPLHVSAHPSCTVHGIAEKAADMILLGKQLYLQMSFLPSAMTLQHGRSDIKHMLRIFKYALSTILVHLYPLLYWDFKLNSIYMYIRI